METIHKKDYTITRFSEVEKALKQQAYGVPIADFFRIEAESYKYGKIGYLGVLKEELTHLEEHPFDIDGSWEIFFEMVEELKKGVLVVQELITPSIKENPENPKRKPRLTDDRFRTIFPDSVPELYELLNAKGLVKTSKEHFVWAFGIGKDKPIDFKPIIWQGSNTQLAYLIDKIVETMNKWKVGNLIFGVEGLAQSFNNCKGDPRDKGVIDDIIFNIG